ncbi:MAG: winged helix-turn-helix domain-containing protein, partial [Myxococcota bacterium]
MPASSSIRISERYQLGALELDVESYRLTRDGAEVPVQPKPMELLVLLCRAAGRVVTHEAIHAALWPDVTVTEQSLRQVLMKLRGALASGGVTIETVPRVGLRLPPDACSPVRLAPAGLAGWVPAARGETVGRTADLGALEDRLVHGARLVSIVGPGGVGKTRLALDLARARPDRWPGGVWWCELTDARDLDGILRAASRTLGVPVDGSVDQVGYVWAEFRTCLAVFDNFEQVAEHAGASLGRWLDLAPELRIVVTSQHRLNLPGEEVLELGPLSPDAARDLLIQRAEAASRGLDDVDRAALPELVALLDGLPLAIELAAARIRVLQAPQLVARLR